MKKYIFLAIGIFFVLAIGLITMGANTTDPAVKLITITGLDDDWYGIKQGFPNGIELWAVVFYPSATNDRMIIHDGGLDNDEIFDSGTVADSYDRTVLYYPPKTFVKPVIDITDCTLGTAASARVKIYYR